MSKKDAKRDKGAGRLTRNRSRWYRISNLATGGAEVMIYDEIGYMGVTAQDFINELSGVKGPLNLRLNTPGGEVFDGLAIYNALRSRGNVSITIDGLAASIGSVIAMAADPGKLNIARRASMMIHDGFSQGVGNAKDMRELADLLDQQSDNIAGVYADRTGKPASYWRDQMKKETWYTGEQAVEAGLADQVVDGAPNASTVFTAKSLSPISARVLAARATTEAVLVNSDGSHAPMSGTHAHSHAAYGTQGGDTMHSHEHTHDGDAHHEHGHGETMTDHSHALVSASVRPCPHCQSRGAVNARFCGSCGNMLLMAADDNGWVQDPDGSWRFDPDGDGDDDSTPEGDTDHDYFDPDGKKIKDIPPCPGKMADLMRSTLLNFDVDNSEWDASKAWHNGATADNPAAFYKAICAGRKSGDPDNQSSWALPYKYTPSSPPNAGAVRAGLAALGGARGGVQGLTNRDQAQSMLEGLMKKINPDYEPSASDHIDAGLLMSFLTTALEGGK